jgi:hypothetical protein
MSARRLLSGVLSRWCVLAVALLSFCGTGQTAFASVPGQPEACPNSAFRLVGPSAMLPDCRAYELVTPVDKNGSDIVGNNRSTIVSDSGDRFAFAALGGIGDTEGSGGFAISQYIATRGASFWSTHGITPTPALSAVQIFAGDTFNIGFSSDLSSSLVTAYDLPEATGGIPNSVNLYREDTSTNRLETITTPLGSESISPFAFLFGNHESAYSADMGVVAFQVAANLLPDTGENGNEKLYSWNHGRLELAGILPDGSIPAGGSASAVPEGSLRENLGTVSRDGSRILFVSPVDGSSPEQLYMRKDGTSTVWVSQPESSAPNFQPLKVHYEATSSDGHEVVFSTSDRLLDSDPGGGGTALYRYTDSAKPESESNLTFIARVQAQERSSFVVAMSGDGTHIYFASKETAELPAGGGEGNGEVQLYLWDRGTVHWVAGPLNDRDLVRADESGESGEAWISADGRRLAFAVETGGFGPPTKDQWDMYLYDETTEALRCASCTDPSAPSAFGVERLPQATVEHSPFLAFPQRHVLSRDGRYVFFSTTDALVPQDTNGLVDAYEYDVEKGEVSLLSPGTGDYGSWFTEASPSGRDVFIVTREPLSGRDLDRLVDVYDVRVDGGLPEPPPAAVPCAGDACQGVPSAVPTFGTASGFSGLGNVVGGRDNRARLKVKKKPRHKKPKHKKRRVKHKRHAGQANKPAKWSSNRVGR